MATPVFNRERAARILVDAIQLGDAVACAQWKITSRTLVRYRARLESDPKLSAVVRQLGRKAEAHWSGVRMRFLSRAIQKLETLVESATAQQIRDVSEAVRVVGELQVAAAVLNEPGADREGAAAQEAAADSGEHEASQAN